ncbi:MAG: SET domain-containing protein-lysine N-methyltransferase [Acidobacteria bacterium]|nr:SET domain-containing protein-lysine N-methyltransferase [Acidobacteriota bacterium]
MTDARYVLWVDDGDGVWRGIDGQNELRYLNHSSQPNAGFDGPELYALRTIRVGDEITFHYGDEWEGVD